LIFNKISLFLIYPSMKFTTCDNFGSNKFAFTVAKNREVLYLCGQNLKDAKVLMR
jgi:hypothetical protein